MNSGKIVLGVLAGLAVGATLGILFAPDKDSSTGKKISRKRDEYADELEKKFEDFIDTSKKKTGFVREEATLKAENGRQG
jgi:gas vesicle protein